MLSLLRVLNPLKVLSLLKVLYLQKVLNLSKVLNVLKLLNLLKLKLNPVKVKRSLLRVKLKVKGKLTQDTGRPVCLVANIGYQ